jgi:ornithine carbamoyltransferase
MPLAGSILKRITPIAAPHLLRDTDLSPNELRALLRLAIEMKQSPDDYRQTLTGRYIALLFEKPSLRSRMTVEVAI